MRRLALALVGLCLASGTWGCGGSAPADPHADMPPEVKAEEDRMQAEMEKKIAEHKQEPKKP